MPSGFRMLVKMGSKMKNLALKVPYLPVVSGKCTKDVFLHHVTWFLNTFLNFHIFSYYLTISSFGDNNHSVFLNWEPVPLIIYWLSSALQWRKNTSSFVNCQNLIKHILTDNDRNLHDLLGMEHKTYVHFNYSVKPHKILRELH